MSFEEMVDAFNEIRVRHTMPIEEIIRRLTWLVDNEVPEYADEIEQDYSEDIVTDPRDKDRRFYYLDQRDFEMFRMLLKLVKNATKEKKEGV